MVRSLVGLKLLVLITTVLILTAWLVSLVSGIQQPEKGPGKESPETEEPPELVSGYFYDYEELLADRMLRVYLPDFIIHPVPAEDSQAIVEVRSNAWATYLFENTTYNNQAVNFVVDSDPSMFAQHAIFSGGANEFIHYMEWSQDPAVAFGGTFAVTNTTVYGESWEFQYSTYHVSVYRDGNFNNKLDDSDQLVERYYEVQFTPRFSGSFGFEAVHLHNEYQTLPYIVALQYLDAEPNADEREYYGHFLLDADTGFFAQTVKFSKSFSTAVPLGLIEIEHGANITMSATRSFQWSENATHTYEVVFTEPMAMDVYVDLRFGCFMFETAQRR